MKAKAIGEEHGRNSGSKVFDGNTNFETYEETLGGIIEGDPEIMDRYNTPNFTNEYADYMEGDLLRDLGLDPNDLDVYETLQDELITEYEDAARQAFWDALEHVCREHVTDKNEQALLEIADQMDLRLAVLQEKVKVHMWAAAAEAVASLQNLADDAEEIIDDQIDFQNN